MLVNHNIIDYMVKSCVDTYNLGEARLIKQNLEEKKVQFAFKRADLKLSVEFANDKISSIIYNSFLTDQQRENVTEQEFTAKLNDMLAVKTVESVEEIEKMSNEIIRAVNSSKLFGGKVKQLLLNSEDREKLFKIKNFFGAEKQLLKLYEEIEELQAAYRNYRKSFYKKDENLIEEIADCFVIALQINKVKMIKNMIRGMVDNSSVFKTEMIEKIIRMVKFKINRTVDRIEKGEYGVYKIEYKADRGTEQPENSKEKELEDKNSTEEKEEQKTGNMTKSEKEKLKKEQKIYEFIKNKSPFYYRSKEVRDGTKIHPTECTEIVKELIEKGKIKIIKKGKDGIYGATLSISENIQEAEVVS
jgi:hypothetical protein|nr:MAG TPA: NTP-PPase-like protein [Caudoviricetes sp.]